MLIFPFEKLEKKEQSKPKANRRKEIMHRKKINETEKEWKEISETKCWFFAKINKTDKSSAILNKK